MSDKPAKEFDNYELYKNKINEANDKELSLFNEFYEKITNHAKSHKHITLNNISSVKESLENLREKANKLKEDLFFHEEAVVVDRQEVISGTEKSVHKENFNLLSFERTQADNKIDALDYLNKAAIQNKFNFFDKYIQTYANTIMNFEGIYEYYSDKTREIDKIFKTYHDEILESFKKLDTDITEMDSRILVLMKQKNTQLKNLNDFFNKEKKNFVDNQLTFSLEEDPTSINIQALISDKIIQQEAFKEHLFNQEEKIKNILNEEYVRLYNKTLERVFNERGFALFQDTGFFSHPNEYIFGLKQKIAVAKSNDSKTLDTLVKRYNLALKHVALRKKCAIRAKHMTKKFLKNKQNIFLEFQKESRNLIFKMEKYYRLYLELLKIDPFLAQIIGDNATKIIKDELNFLSMSEMNREYKINVNFDIKMLKIKQQINDLESKLVYEIEKQILVQDIDILKSIAEVQGFFAENKVKMQKVKNNLLLEKYSIDLLQEAINLHMEYLIGTSNVNRKWLSIITNILVRRIRDVESHNINVIEAASKIKLALKEYDVKALHFNTMYENEKKYLVSQSNRVDEETEINDAFILTTYENQMRFAREQVELANNEYRLRVEAIMKAVAEEKAFFQDVVDRRMKEHKDKRNLIADEYQAMLYHDTNLLTEATDPKLIRQIEKQIVKNKRTHDDMQKEIQAIIDGDEKITKAKGKIMDLDEHLVVALQDATEIRDETIAEFNDLYQTAKQKYDALKPYLANRVHILEPSLKKTLEKIQERRNYKLKMAEIELDEATQNLMDNYLHVFFEEMPEIDKNKYIEQIESMEAERNIVRDEYGVKMQAIDNQYKANLAAIEVENKNLDQTLEAARQEIIQKSEKIIQTKKSQLVVLEEKFALDNSKQDEIFQTEINNMLKEFNTSLVKNEKDFENLSGSFDLILKTYYPYLKVAQNNKAIKKIVKQTEKKVRSRRSKEMKKLTHTSKLTNYLSN